ncbi:unnamed protein product [Linum trigynum]|uniref:Uncharacterized protein n=1 Tax=Linum trigynum TaxID=586398 RepID=A0AAV2GQF2_9ROSI
MRRACGDEMAVEMAVDARQAAQGGGAPTPAVEMAEGSAREGGETMMATGEREERERDDGGVRVFFFLYGRVNDWVW